MRRIDCKCSRRATGPLVCEACHLCAASFSVLLAGVRMSQTEISPAFKPKKSVALSGTPAGNTALCTVGHTGNDLHYRGYNIHDLAAHCEFEEVAWLLVHGKLPTAIE